MHTWSSCQQVCAEDHASAASDALAAHLLPWLQNTVTSLNHDIRRQDKEQIVMRMNCTIAGVMSAGLQHFLRQWTGTVLYQFLATACAATRLRLG